MLHMRSASLKTYGTRQFEKIDVLVNFIIQKLKSKHLFCLSFLWWQVIVREWEKTFPHILDQRHQICQLPWTKQTLDCGWSNLRRRLYLWYSGSFCSGKVWVFWEGHKILKKIFVVLLTRASCSVRATAYLSKVDDFFFKDLNVDRSYYTNFTLPRK